MTKPADGYKDNKFSYKIIRREIPAACNPTVTFLCAAWLGLACDEKNGMSNAAKMLLEVDSLLLSWMKDSEETK